VKLFGGALWYTYDYEIVSPQEHLALGVDVKKLEVRAPELEEVFVEFAR